MKAVTTSARANPYVGPRAFEPGEQLYGRNREVLDLLDLLIAERIVLLYSRSGAGKTSLIQAALLPELDKKRFRILPIMRVGHEPPPGIMLRNRYILSLLLSLEQGVPDTHRLPLVELMNLTLPAYLARREAEADAPGRLILILDQFEEVLLYPTDQDAKEEFFKQVGEVLQDRRRWALFSMREDYLASLDSFKPQLPTRLRATFRLDLLGKEAACLAICEPARQIGVEFADETVQKLVSDLRLVRVQQRDGTVAEQLGPNIEPVQLQVVCQSLWEGLPPEITLITPEHLRAFGDVNQALSRFYVQAIRRTTQSVRVTEARLRDWFDHTLITPAGTRGMVYRGKDSTGNVPNAAVNILEDLHLIRGEWRSGARWYELTHDRFIGPIQRSNSAWHAARRARWLRIGLGALLLTFIGWIVVYRLGANPAPDQQLQAAATEQAVRLAEIAASGTASAAEARQVAATATTESRHVATQIAQLTSDPRGRNRPIRPGFSVAGETRTASTLGAFVRDAKGNFYFLASTPGMGSPGTAVLQPGPYDGGKVPDDVVGTADRQLSLVGLVRLSDSTTFSSDILNIGTIRGVRDPQVGMSIQKSGRTTGYTNGTIEQTDATFSVDLDGASVTITNTAIAGPMAVGGDEGALVLDMENYAVGIVVGESDTRTYLMPIRDVLNQLDVQLVGIAQ